MNGPLLLLPIHCKDFEKTEIVLSKEFSWHCFEFICNKFLIHNSFFFSKQSAFFFSKTRGFKEPYGYLAVYLTGTTIFA